MPSSSSNSAPKIVNERLLKGPLAEEIIERVSVSIPNFKGETLVVNQDVLKGISGIYYENDFISENEEKEIVDEIIDKHAFSTHLQRRQQFYGITYYHTKCDNIHLQPAGSATDPLALEEVASTADHAYGAQRDDRKLADQTQSDPHSITPFLPIMKRCIEAGFFGPDPSLHPDQVLVNEYTQSIGIRSHFEDENAFGAVIVTISLGDPIWITLKKPLHHLNSCPSIVEYTKILLKPRSVFIMAKDARYEYRHGISKAKNITTSIDPLGKVTRDATYRRLSLTIRKLGDGRKRVADSEVVNEHGWLDSDPLQGDKCDCE